MKATMDVTGRPVTADNQEFIEMVAALKAFPTQGYREANNHVTEIILKYFNERVVSIKYLLV